jgi:ribosomal protein L11 methyltransferase
VGDANWLRISLSLNGELAEAVAEVLDRFVSNGIVIESKIRHIDEQDEGTPEGNVIVSGYLFMDEIVEEKKKQIEEALWHLGQIQPLPPARYKVIKDKDWMSAWKKHYHPIPIGERLEIVPAWIKESDTSRIPILINPSMAFGTGTHPSTQLCLEYIEQYAVIGRPFIDVGCGSGILSIAALKLGASHALAVDIDPAAAKNTKSNAKANGVAGRIEVGVGSVEEIHAGRFSIRKAPLVVVNILAPVIIHMLQSGLVSLVSRAGILVLAGILDTQLKAVDEAARSAGLSFVTSKYKNDWCSPVYRK